MSYDYTADEVRMRRVHLIVIVVSVRSTDIVKTIAQICGFGRAGSYRTLVCRRTCISSYESTRTKQDAIAPNLNARKRAQNIMSCTNKHVMGFVLVPVVFFLHQMVCVGLCGAKDASGR